MRLKKMLSLALGICIFLLLNSCQYLQREGKKTVGGITLAQNGTALAPIVVKDKKGVAGFAAKELKKYLEKITGAKFQIVSSADSSPRIFVGDCVEAQKAGLDVSRLKRDGFYRVVVDGDLFLLGRDHKKAWKLALRTPTEHATLFAVYDFLEDVCGVRFFKAGPYGEVVPEDSTLFVLGKTAKEEPYYLDRYMSTLNIHHYQTKPNRGLKKGEWYPDADKHAVKKAGVYFPEDRLLWTIKMRWNTIGIAKGCHTVHHLKFGERFGDEHPEWFSLKSNSERALFLARGSYLCWSHPGVVDAFIKDARAYFTGKSPQSRGLASWPNAIGGGNEFMVDPHDSYAPCQCEKCLAVYNKDPSQDYSEIIYKAIAEVAEGIKDLKGKYITTLAYPPKTNPPKTVTLPSNVRIRLAIHSDVLFPYGFPDTRDEQIALIKEWSSRTKGDLVLWLYTDIAWYRQPLYGAVETQPRIIADFLKMVKPYVQGAFFENESVYQTYRFLDEYVIMKLLWNPDQDVDELLTDYFMKFYGPAGPHMLEFYGALERLWYKTYSYYGGKKPTFVGTIDLWEKIYTKEKLAELDRMLKKAEGKAIGDEAYTWRVDLIREDIYNRIIQHRKKCAETLGLAKQFNIHCYRAPVGPTSDGILPDNAWEQVEYQSLGLSTSTSFKHELNVETNFKMLWDDENLYAIIECQEPDIANSGTDISRKEDDPSLWKDNDVEIFISYTNEYLLETSYQILVNDRGVMADLARQSGETDWGWDSLAKVQVIRLDKDWTARMAVPLKELGIKNALKRGKVTFNVIRHHVIRNEKPELYTWSRLVGTPTNETTKQGQLNFENENPKPRPRNLLKGGGLDEAGKWLQPLAGWIVPKKGLSYVSLDKKVRWSGKGSARIKSDVFEDTITVMQYLSLSDMKPDTAYRFKCKIKTENIEIDPDPNIKYPNLRGAYTVLFVPGTNKHVPIPAMTGATDWRNIEFAVHTVDTFDKKAVAYVRLNLRHAKGTVWFDKVEVCEIGSKE